MRALSNTFPWFALIVSLQLTLGQVFWDHFALSELEFPIAERGEIYFGSETDIRTMCTYDLLSINWNTTFEPSDHSVAFTIEGQREVTYGSLAMDRSWKRKYHDNIVQCENDHEYCKLTLDTIKLDDKILSLFFDKDTNQPNLLTANSIKEAFTLRPYLNDTASGEWISSRALAISVTGDYASSILAASKSGNFQVTLGADPLGSECTSQDLGICRIKSSSDERATFSGISSFRPVDIGFYKVFFIHTASKKLVSKVHKVHVQMCGDSMPPPGSRAPLQISHRKHDNSKAETLPPKSLMRYRGVLALSGKEVSKGVTIPHKALPQQGSWSLTMWIKLLELPTGNFRCLFYKGDGLDPNRTPSAWFLPMTSRLAIRSSVVDNMDLGADSLVDIPINEWVHLAFVFQNQTTTTSTSQRNSPITTELSSSSSSSSNSGETAGANATHEKILKRGPYVITVFVNGQLDVALTYSDNVVPNSHPLNLFKDLSHQGPKGFAADIVIWDSPLSEIQVQALARKSSYADHSKITRPIDKALDLVGGYLNMLPKQVQSVKTTDTHHNIDDDTGVDELMAQQQHLKLSADEISAFTVGSILEKETWFDLLSDERDDGRIIKHGFTFHDGKGSPLETILKQINTAVTSCAPPEDRLDLYSEASAYGHIESLFKWSMLLGFGSEIPNTPCGIEIFNPPSDILYHEVVKTSVDEMWNREYELLSSGNVVSDQVRAAVGLIIAVQNGYAAALVPLSTMLSTSVGISALLRDFHSVEGNALLAVLVERIPLPSSSLDDCEGKGSAVVIVDSDRCVNMQLVLEFSTTLRQTVFGDSVQSSDANMRTRDHASTVAMSRNAKASEGAKLGVFQQREGLLLARTRPTRRGPQLAQFEVAAAKSVFALSMGTEKKSITSDTDELTELSTALLHIAAANENVDAQMGLYKRYHEGYGGLQADAEVAGHYGLLAAGYSSSEFHRIGAQSVVESDRITDETELVIAKGNSGADDQHIQTLSVQAQEGDIPSMLALGELYYYGTRGLPRDQHRALELYSEAASLGDQNGMCGAAGMLLKGEGGEKNVSRALVLYEKAASMGSIRAFNGLGYVYFFGHGDEAPLNKTKAFHHFLRATEFGGDSDSWFNAGYCLEHGVGVAKDITRAASFYLKGATQFGHFDSIYALGSMHLQGQGVARSPKDALYYLTAANAIGPWAGWLRRGLNQYLQGQSSGKKGYYERSVLCYLHAGELGYEVSIANSAFILRRKLSEEARRLLIGTELIFPLTAPSNSLIVSDLLVDDQGKSDVSRYLTEGLLVRQLALSAQQGNAESAQLLGNHFLHTSASTMFGHRARDDDSYHQCVGQGETSSARNEQGAGDTSLDTDEFDEYLPSTCAEEINDDHIRARSKAALWWFSRSSAMGNYMGSLQAGLLNHFGIGTPGGQVNVNRAKRYYNYALASAVPMPVSLQMVTKSLLWLASKSSESGLVRRINGALSWIARTVLNEEGGNLV